MLDMHEVIGSIPTVSTKSKRSLHSKLLFDSAPGFCIIILLLQERIIAMTNTHHIALPWIVALLLLVAVSLVACSNATVDNPLETAAQTDASTEAPTEALTEAPTECVHVTAYVSLDDTTHQATCTTCAAVLATEEHSWDEGTVTTEPTEETEGVRAFTCTACTFARTEAIDKLLPQPPYTLRVGSYNIAHGKLVSHDMTVLGADIQSLALDIVGVQEVDQFADRSGNVDTMKLMSESSGLEHYAYFKTINISGGEYGIGLLSRFPILESETIQLSSPDVEQRVVGRAVLDVYGTHITVFVTHLSYEKLSIRTTQMQELAALAMLEESYLVLADFNTANFTEFSPFSDGTLLNNKTYSVPTFPQHNTAIDNMVYSSEWVFGKPETFDEGHSDHRLLYAEAVYTPESASVESNQ